MLAMIGGGLGALAMRDVLAGPRHAEPKELDVGQKRGLTMIGPQTVTGKAQRETPVPVYRPPPPPPPAPATVRRPNPCDPPYTIDPATGRKKYKMECLH